jgi:ParB family chromosome partitioning protein
MPANETIQYIPLDLIITEKQPRETFDESAIDGMAVTLEEVGQLQPIRVRKVNDRFVVVDGERRVRASRKRGAAKIAAIVEPEELGEGDILHRQLISDCQKEHLAPLERANAISRLMQTKGYSATEVAGRIGMSPGSVAKYLALLKLPIAIRESVAAGAIPASAAYELAQIEDPARQAELAQQLAERRLTRDGLAGARKASRTDGTAGEGQTQAARARANLGDGRSVTVVAKGLNLDLFIEILVALLAEARKVRTRGVELSTFLRIMKDQSQ